MMMVPCYLGPSAIEGLGVFCPHDIKAGETIWRFEPLLDLLIPADKIDTFPEHIRVFIDRYTYPHMTDTGFVVLDADEGRFMNHADHPNLDFSDPLYGRALIDIPANTELTCDYRCFTFGALEFQPPRHMVTRSASDTLHAPQSM